LHGQLAKGGVKALKYLHLDQIEDSINLNVSAHTVTYNFMGMFGCIWALVICRITNTTDITEALYQYFLAVFASSLANSIIKRLYLKRFITFCNNRVIVKLNKEIAFDIDKVEVRRVKLPSNWLITASCTEALMLRWLDTKTNKVVSLLVDDPDHKLDSITH